MSRSEKLIIAPDCSAGRVYNRCMRPVFNWKLRSRSLKLGERTLVMGIVNVTPDSFSDGGQFFDSDRAIAHALELLSEGAEIVDVGGESTRPGEKDFVSADEEKRRVLPVIEGILRRAPDAVISIDTYKAETAKAALDVGAEIVNDVSGFRWDEAMLPTLTASTCGCVLMHTRGRPQEWRSLPPQDPAEVVPLVFDDLRRLAESAVDAGVQRERIVLDPGFGFGKRLDENFSLLARFAELHQLKFPLLSGTSRKSFLAKGTTGDGGADRLAGTIATITASILQGAHLVRVHDVRSTVEAVRVADSILRAIVLAHESAEAVTPKL
jgi:dihydropteroate synthase